MQILNTDSFKTKAVGFFSQVKVTETLHGIFLSKCWSTVCELESSSGKIKGSQKFFAKPVVDIHTESDHLLFFGILEEGVTIEKEKRRVNFFEG